MKIWLQIWLLSDLKRLDLVHPLLSSAVIADKLPFWYWMHVNYIVHRLLLAAFTGSWFVKVPSAWHGHQVGQLQRCDWQRVSLHSNYWLHTAVVGCSRQRWENGEGGKGEKWSRQGSTRKQGKERRERFVIKIFVIHQVHVYVIRIIIKHKILHKFQVSLLE